MRASVIRPLPGTKITDKFPCRYTTQVRRKKPIWQDGILKVSKMGGSYRVTLFDPSDLRDKGLEGRMLNPKEAMHFAQKSLDTITMEHHIVELSFESDPQPYEPPVKVSKFKPPSQIVRPPVVRDELFDDQYRAPVSHLNNPRRRYEVQDDELDKIWDDGKQNERVLHDETNAPSRDLMTSGNSYPRATTIPNSSTERDLRMVHSSLFPTNEIDEQLSSLSDTNVGKKRFMPSMDAPRPAPRQPFHEDSTSASHIRGSMKRVDQSIWDD